MGLVVLGTGWRYVSPRRRPRSTLPADLNAEVVSFESLDGTRLAGLFLPGREDCPGLILCHGYFKSLDEPFDLGMALNREGYNVFLFDFRACGLSGGRFTTIGYKETLDVLAAVRFLKSRLSGRPIGLLGISMGAAAGMAAASRSEEIQCLVLDSPYADLKGVVQKKVRDFAPHPWLVPLGRASVWAGEILSCRRFIDFRPASYFPALAPRPILLIFGERDGYLPREQIIGLAEAATENTQLWTVDGCGHASARLQKREEYIGRVVAFFDQHLRDAGAEGSYVPGPRSTSV